MSKQETIEKAHKLEGMAITAPEQVAKELHNMSPKERKAIAAQIKADQANDTSGALPHIEFYDSSNQVKSVESKSTNDKHHTIDKQAKFDEKSGKMTSNATDDEYRGYHTKVEDRYDTKGRHTGHREEAPNKSVMDETFDPKTGNVIARDSNLGNGYSTHFDFDPKTKKAVRSVIHSPSADGGYVDTTTAYDKNGTKTDEWTNNQNQEGRHKTFYPNGIVKSDYDSMHDKQF